MNGKLILTTEKRERKQEEENIKKELKNLKRNLYDIARYFGLKHRPSSRAQNKMNTYVVVNIKI